MFIIVHDTHRYGSVTLVSNERITMVPSRMSSASSGNAVTARTRSALPPGASFNLSPSTLCWDVANDTIDSNGSFGGNSTRTLLAVRNPSFVIFTYVKMKQLLVLAGIPAEGKSSVCQICMKYRIIILIIIIISLGKIESSYIANSSRTHACTDVRTRTLAHTHTPTQDRYCSLFRCAQPWLSHGWAHPTRRWRDNGRSATHWNKQTHWPPDFPEILEVARVYTNW